MLDVLLGQFLVARSALVLDSLKDVGTLLSFVPIFLLTVIPQLLHLAASIDGTRSMIFLVFFPIAMAYSLLRYELLVFDIYVRRVVTWVIFIKALPSGSVVRLHYRT